MNIIPSLNLNKHPNKVDNYNLIDAVNVIVSKDNSLIQSEPKLNDYNINEKLNNAIKDLIQKDINYTIKYIHPCSKELIIFCKDVNDDDNIYLFRYSEVYDEVKYSTTIEYNGGEFIVSSIYNSNELIIAISEYFDDDSKKIPLRTINLGEFNKTYSIDNDNNINQLTNTNLHSLCPKVRIPSIRFDYCKNSAYKGWYYVFVRYKISNNNYTQWFNTNESIFIDDYTNSSILDFYRYDYEWTAPNGDIQNYEVHCIADVNISDNKDITNKSFIVIVDELINGENNLDTNYNSFQLGFICISKTYTKAYKTTDLAITNHSYIAFNFNSNSIEEYSAKEIIKSYYNYFNVKAMTVHSNKLYISNYKENNYEKDLIHKVNNIDITILCDTVVADTIVSDNGVYIENVYKTHGIYPWAYYNYFIHFVDEYGNCTKGINISNFKNIYTDNDNIKIIANKIGNVLISYDLDYDFTMTRINSAIHLSHIPDGYVGWFISYEKLENNIKHIGIAIKESDKTYNFYNDTLNINESIDLNINKIRFYNSIIVDNNVIEDEGKHYLHANLNKNVRLTNTNYKDYDIANTKIYAADSINNILQSSRINIKINNNPDITTAIAILYDDNVFYYYTNKNKILIPCSNIIYKGTYCKLNIKSCFISENHAIIWNGKSFFNTTNSAYNNINATSKRELRTHTPFYLYKFYIPIEIPIESSQYNNKPDIKFYPYNFKDGGDEYDAFNVGNIIECKNTIDVFKQPQVSIDELYPKSLNWYNDSIDYKEVYNKTIRRSNVIQDESDVNAWRNFEIDDYKIINENKGNIIKLISIGYYFICHTEHSIFLFNATNSIKSNNNENIQLSNVDIWDIDYKELVTSELGYAGLSNKNHSILGSFGYIFYDKDNKAIYRYDNNSVNRIDSDIINFIDNLKDYDVNLVDDKHNNRVLFNFHKNDSIVISYNYNTNTFVSRHEYNYKFGISTKEISYFVVNDKIVKYNYNDYYNSNISVIVNTNNYAMKYLNYIKYNINNIDKKLINDFSPIHKLNNTYAGDYIRIYNDVCDTDFINISTNIDDLNKVSNYKKPYWRMGNWHFNYIRNNISNHEIYDGKDYSKMFGNWFIINMSCNTNKQIEYENIDVDFSNAENV